MVELVVNFTSLRTFNHHRTLGHAMTGKGNNPSHTHVSPDFVTHGRHKSYMHAIAESLFPALASPRGRCDAAVRVLHSCFSQRLFPADDSMHDRSRLPDKIYNVHYKNDIRYTMQLCRWILKPIGIWHLVYDRSSQYEKLISITLIFACFSVLCFVLVPSGPYTLLREKDINVKLKLFGPVGFCLTSAIKYCFLGMRGTAIGKCIKHVEHDWQVIQYQDHRKMMLRNVLVGRRLTTLCVIFLYTGGMSYHTIMPLLSRMKTNDNYTNRPLVYPGYDIYFDPQPSPVYEIVFCIHCLSAIIQYSITTAVCSLAAIFATHACGQVQILMTLLDDLVDGEKNKNTTVDKRLTLITRHHVRVLR